MNGEAMKLLLDEAHAAEDIEIIDIGDVKFSSRVLHDTRKPVPRPEAMKLATLIGLVDYIKSKPDAFEALSFVHVHGPEEVQFKSPFSGPVPSRATYAFARADCGFKFGQFYDSESFIIALQALFVQTPITKALLLWLGQIKDESVKTSEDDGTVQTVTARAGAVLRAEVSVPNPVALQPYRTFRELDQPESGFVFRMGPGKEGARPTCALFEADGGAWRIVAAERIKAYLEPRLPGITIIA